MACNFSGIVHLGEGSIAELISVGDYGWDSLRFGRIRNQKVQVGSRIDMDHK